MSTSDWIALCALSCAVLSAAIALYALREVRRANSVALLDRRVLIYDAFKRLATEALCRGAQLSADEVEAFAPHARAAEVHLPEPLAAEVGEFYNDCETLVWAQRLTQPPAREYVLKGEAAALRVHRTALAIDGRLLALVRRATTT